MARQTRFERASPRDILQAWQDGEIGYRDALRLTASDSLFELFRACRSNGVRLRTECTSQDLAVVDAVMATLLHEDAREP